MDSVEAVLVQEFIDESMEGLQEAERCLVALEADSTQQPVIQELFVFFTRLRVTLPSSAAKP